MRCAPIIIGVWVLGLAGCDIAGSGSVRAGGHGAVGVSVGDRYVTAHHGLGGPPPGRTKAEREARRDYYRGPRGHEF